jgi:hypothetical protein
LDPKYPITNSYVTKSIVNVINGEFVDESKTCILASIGIFYLFVEIISNEKKWKEHQ